jgi:uncharacterized protein
MLCFAEIPHDLATMAVLALTAALAGALNSIAGGGTLLTFPALTAVISDAAANATSTLALMPGSLAGAWGYRREFSTVRRFALVLIAPSIVGGFVGAALVIASPGAFSMLVPWLILTAAMLFLIQQPLQRWLRAHPTTEPSRRRVAVIVIAQLLIAIYGGYFGAGIGILMLTSLGFMGIDNIHHRNSVKTLLAAMINVASVIVFILGGDGMLIHWPYAAVMAIAAVLGGYVGARVARRLSAAVVRRLVIAIGFGLAIYYFTR